jgi:hypothetical protein
MRKIASRLCIVLALVSLAPLALAKGVRPNTVAEACAKAPVIVMAELVRGEYETLEEGNTRKVDVYALWTEFRITEVLKGEPPKKGAVLRLVEKSNSCIRYLTTATRKGKTVQLTVNRGKTTKIQTLKIADLEKRHGQKVVLFLSPVAGKKGKWQHWGWFVSPKTANKKIEAQVRDLIAKAKK